MTLVFRASFTTRFTSLLPYHLESVGSKIAEDSGCLPGRRDSTMDTSEYHESGGGPTMATRWFRETTTGDQAFGALKDWVVGCGC
jgi:hypothetical protein